MRSLRLVGWRAGRLWLRWRLLVARRAVAGRVGWPVLVVFLCGPGGAGFWGFQFWRGRGGVGLPAWRLMASGPFLALALVWWSRDHGRALAAYRMRPSPAVVVSVFR